MGTDDTPPSEQPGGGPAGDPFVAIVREVTQAVVDFGGRLTALEKSVDADHSILADIKREVKARREAEQRTAEAQEKLLALEKETKATALAQSNQRWDRAVALFQACVKNPLFVAPATAAVMLILQLIAAYFGMELPTSSGE